MLTHILCAKWIIRLVVFLPAHQNYNLMRFKLLTLWLGLVIYHKSTSIVECRTEKMSYANAFESKLAIWQYLWTYQTVSQCFGTCERHLHLHTKRAKCCLYSLLYVFLRHVFKQHFSKVTNAMHVCVLDSSHLNSNLRALQGLTFLCFDSLIASSKEELIQYGKKF